MSEPLTAEGSPGASLSRTSVRGGVAFVLARGGVDATRLASILVLARLLSPSEFGTVALVVAVVGISEVLQDFGLSMASVQRRDLTARHASTLMWINVGIATVLTLLVVLLAPWIAVLVGQPDVVGLTRLLAPTFLISAVAAQHLALLQRSLRFGALATIRSVKSVVYAVVAIGMALAGFGRSSLVWGLLASGVVETTMAVALSPLRVRRPRFDQCIREVARLGGSLLGYSVLTYLAGAVPMLAIGRAHGASATGVYGRAQRLVGLSTGYLVAPVGSVVFPVLSRLAGQPERWARYYYEAQAMLALPALCVAPFLVAHAPLIVDVALGSQWADATPVVAVLALAVVVSVPSTPTGWVLVSLGRGDRLLKWGAFGWLVVLAGTLAGVPHGVTGVAVGYLGANALLVWPCLRYAFRDTPLSVRHALQVAFGPLPAAACGVAASIAVAGAMPTTMLPVAELATVGLTHVAVFGGVVVISPRQRRLVVTVIDRLRRPRPAAVVG